ncbi:MAG: DUF2793 domain-containing protein [Hyphomicrobiaceae bacterium]|nr:DUF2793 domain-containing protein [Hyphomicrobiaceae bacterium]
MDETANLNLPYLIAAQAQKHVTHNEALRMLDAIVQLTVEDRHLTAPPVTPADGERYIVAAGATGAWAGHDAEIAAFQEGAWAYYPPAIGFLAWVADEAELRVWDGTSWALAAASGGGGVSDHGDLTGLGDDDHPHYHTDARGDARYLQGVNPTALVGVNATADTTNRLSVASAASLFTHPGSGGHQQKINKALAADTASVLYQTGFSGRAEMGTTGDDDFHFKVSPDGATWHEAIVIDKDTGAVALPNTTLGGGGHAILQEVLATYADHTTTSALIPWDDTIPQNTEGTEIMTAVITPANAANKIRVWVTVHGGIASADNFAVALFKNSEANAIAAEFQTVAGGYGSSLFMMHEFTAGSTSAITLKVRAGPRTSTLYFNGRTVTPGTGRLFGGVSPCKLLIQEIAA